MIIANGMPKSGTHALMAHLEAKGLRRYPGIIKGRDKGIDLRHLGGWDEPIEGYDFVHGHVPTKARKAAEGFDIVTIFRDPRNVLASYARAFKAKWGGRPNFIAAMDDFFGRPFAAVAAEYVEWPKFSEIVRYEDLQPPVSATRLSQTWTGSPSHWREWWTPEIDAAWHKRDGSEIVTKFGY